MPSATHCLMTMSLPAPDAASGGVGSARLLPSLLRAARQEPRTPGRSFASRLATMLAGDLLRSVDLFARQARFGPPVLFMLGLRKRRSAFSTLETLKMPTTLPLRPPELQ